MNVVPDALPRALEAKRIDSSTSASPITTRTTPLRGYKRAYVMAGTHVLSRIVVFPKIMGKNPRQQGTILTRQT